MPVFDVIFSLIKLLYMIIEHFIKDHIELWYHYLL